MIGPTSMHVVHSPRAGTTTSKLARSAVTMAGGVKRTSTPRITLPRR